MIELYFETGRGDMGIPGICICSLIKKNYALAIDGTVPYHHCSILSVFFFYFILRMGLATLLKNAVNEVVAMQELVHWVTAPVARVSLYFFF